MKNKLWKKWLRKQSVADIYKIASIAIERLMELEEVDFQQDDFIDRAGHVLTESEVLIEMLYWKNSGESLLEGETDEPTH